MSIITLHYLRDLPREMHQIIEYRNTVGWTVCLVSARSDDRRPDSGALSGRDVTCGISDHPTLCRLESELGLCPNQQTRPWFTTLAVVLIGMGTYINPLYFSARSGDIPTQGLVYAFKLLRCQLTASDAGLIRNNQHTISFSIQFSDCFRRVRQQHKLLFGSHGSREIPVDNAIAIQENEAGTTLVLLIRASGFFGSHFSERHLSA
jgi:hypothetical protein